MKKVIIIAIALIVILTATVAKADETNEPATYAKTAVVIELDYISDIVTVVDGADNLWCFFGCEDFQINDFVSMLMSDNGTPETIYDDVIINVTYAGTFDFLRG